VLRWGGAGGGDALGAVEAKREPSVGGSAEPQGRGRCWASAESAGVDLAQRGAVSRPPPSAASTSKRAPSEPCREPGKAHPQG
jgi:hypothetical protein